MMALLFLGITSCSKDDSGDDNPKETSIDAVVGTFKGTLEVFRESGPTQEYYNAIVTVSKVGEKEIKVTPKSGEAYSDASPETFNIQTLNEIGLYSTNSRLIFQNADKSLVFITNKDQADEIIFHFEGTKQ